LTNLYVDVNIFNEIAFEKDINVLSTITELSLRAAVNKTPTTLADDLASKIKEAALNRAKTQLSASSDSSSLLSRIDAEHAAIALAITGISIAIDTVRQHIKTFKRDRLELEKEMEAGYSSFVLPMDLELKDFSKEESVIKTFLSLTDKFPRIAQYTGIHKLTLETEKGREFLNTLPLYQMSKHLLKPDASKKPVDVQCDGINLFFVFVQEYILSKHNAFKTEHGVGQIFVSAWEKRNYLNDIRAPLFMVTCLCNLLWNLMYPVDSKDGFLFNKKDCVDLCREAEDFLNQLLDENSPYYLGTLFKHDPSFESFIRKVELHVKGLREAHLTEQLQELNIDDITNSTHRTLRMMDKSMFELIYTAYNPFTKKQDPDEKAATHLAHLVNYLQLLNRQNSNLITEINPVPSWISQASLMNRPLFTIIDVLIIFCHATRCEREAILSGLRKSRLPTEIEFAQTIDALFKRFIRPVREIFKTELSSKGVKEGHPKSTKKMATKASTVPTLFSRAKDSVTNIFHENLSFNQRVGQKTASCLLPLFTLLIQDFGIEVDSPEVYEQAKRSRSPNSVKIMLTGKEQVSEINKMAGLDGHHNYYKWTLSSFFNVRSEVSEQLDKFPVQQFRMTQVTMLLDDVSEVVKSYRSLLQYENFRRFLLDCLKKVKAEYKKLDDKVDNFESYLSRDEHMSRSMRSVLRPMISGLMKSLDSFSIAADSFERVVAAPEFIDKERELLSSKLSAIHDQYSSLFAEDSGIGGIADSCSDQALLSPVSKELPEALDEVTFDRILAFRKVVERCYQALSYFSRQGHKGQLLRNLLNLLDSRQKFRETDLANYILELTHIVASYRKTSFFQAKYAETRSSKALMEAVRDPLVNSLLPLAGIILENKGPNTHRRFSNVELAKGMISLCEKHHWEQTVDKVGMAVNI